MEVAITQSEISEITKNARARIQKTETPQSLDKVKADIFGKNGVITDLFKTVKLLPAEQKKTASQMINQAKNELQTILTEQKTSIEKKEVATKLLHEKIDISLPGRGMDRGGTHPIQLCLAKIESFFLSMGFRVVEGPEIEDDYHNFTALNIGASHPARDMHDTFYFNDSTMLRTHTSSVQIRNMTGRKPPFSFIAPGKVYRRDSDPTHTPMFHQVEGVYVDECVSFSNLKWLLYSFLENFFGAETKIRFRASYFPFTEPSAEVDILGENGKWLEVLGCGMIHPNVLQEVGIDPMRYSGLAFGMGVERLAMLRYRFSDLRPLFENDVRVLHQFH